MRATWLLLLLAGPAAAAPNAPAGSVGTTVPALPEAKGSEYRPLRLGPPAVPPAGGEADLAYGAYQRGQYVTALKEATARIERDSGDAPAMTLLGELHNQGLGTAQDPAKAVSWYRLAAGRGDAHAMASLGLMAIDGRGMAKNPAEGRRWFEQAAELGEPQASYNLALILLAEGGPDALRRGVELLRKAGEAEIPQAQHALGVLSLRGGAVPRNTTDAANWFRRAADNGDVAGEVEYAILLFNGDGVAKDETRAARYFRHAAERGNAIARNRLARLYAAGRGVPKNLVEAGAWHLAAAAQGLKDSWLDGALAGLSEDERGRAERLAAERTGRL